MSEVESIERVTQQLVVVVHDLMCVYYIFAQYKLARRSYLLAFNAQTDILSSLVILFENNVIE